MDTIKETYVTFPKEEEEPEDVNLAGWGDGGDDKTEVEKAQMEEEYEKKQDEEEMNAGWIEQANTTEIPEGW